MGDPTTPEGKAQLERQSPLNSAGKIKTPLLVAQGANDPRVNKAESDRIVIALRDRGFPVSYIVAPDEGHGFARPVNNMALFAAAEEFLARYLDGRFQAGSTPEVAARLKEITVDPKTVVLAKKVDPNAVGAPRPASELKAGITKFKATIVMGSQSINLSVATEIKEEGGQWVIVDNMKTPMGEAVDTTSLEKGSLLFVKRKVVQGPMVVELAYAGRKMTGTMKTGGQEHPVDAELGGPLFGEGAGGMQVLATLPLEQGYKTAFRNFDLQKSKEKLMQLEVTGSEKVTVPAGEFDAWKVEIKPSDGSSGKETLWVDKANHRMVKSASVMPEMGGATITMELE
jgi:hypothetical protein